MRKGIPIFQNVWFGQDMIHTDRRWKGQVRRNYLNKLEGNGKGLLNPIGPTPDEDWLAKKNVMSYFKKKLPAA